MAACKSAGTVWARVHAARTEADRRRDDEAVLGVYAPEFDWSLGRRVIRAPRDTAPAMSEENVEIVRRLAEGFQRRQHERAFEFYDPEIEWDASGLAERPGYRRRLSRPRGRQDLLAELALGVERSPFRDPGRGGGGDDVVL